MKQTKVFAPALATMMFALGACTVSEPAANGTVEAAPADPPAAGGVARETVEREETPVTPIAPATAIQSQPGPDGSQVDLTGLRVTGDILTATFRCSSAEKINHESFRLTNISMVDDATSQRISVLKDNAGNWMASNPTGDSLMTTCEVKPGIFWVKFPAPPATSATVSIALPNTGPFDGVPVTR